MVKRKYKSLKDRIGNDNLRTLIYSKYPKHTNARKTFSNKILIEKCSICFDTLDTKDCCWLDACKHCLCLKCLNLWTECQLTPDEVHKRIEAICKCPKCRTVYSSYFTIEGNNEMFSKSPSKLIHNPIDIYIRPVKSLLTKLNNLIKLVLLDYLINHDQKQIKRIENSEEIYGSSNAISMDLNNYTPHVFDMESVYMNAFENILGEFSNFRNLFRVILLKLDEQKENSEESDEVDREEMNKDINKEKILSCLENYSQEINTLSELCYFKIASVMPKDIMNTDAGKVSLFLNLLRFW